MRKFLAVGLSGFVGMILVLAGLGLISLTQPLLLYAGLVLLILAIFFFIKG